MSHRSKRYQAAKKLVDPTKRYALSEAVALAQQVAGDKIQTVELHFKLGVNPKKAEEIVRGSADLPHGSGKVLRVAAFVTPDQEAAVKAAGADQVGGEDLIKELKAEEKIDFDVAVAMPQLMKFLAPVAKLLGQAGVMPNPKDGTISSTPAKLVEQLKKGRVQFRTDDTGNLHLPLGKTNFTPEQLAQNLDAALEAVKRAKPTASKGTFLVSATLSTTFGPGIPLAV